MAAGRPEAPEKLLRAMEEFASEGGLLPEQVWDAADISEWHRIREDRPDRQCPSSGLTRKIRQATTVARRRLCDEPVLLTR